MSRLTALVGRVRKLRPIVDDDGEKRPVEVAEPASRADVEAFRDLCGGTLPADLAELLSLTAGIEHGALSFKPEPERRLGLDPAFLRASDHGNGDGLAIEPCGDTTRVWWVGHDPWFLVYWAPSLEAFLELFLKRAKAQSEGAEPWQPKRESLEASEDGDEELVAFAKGLPSGTLIHDLRRAVPGTEVPFECLGWIAKGGEMRRDGLLLGFVRGAGAPAPPVQDRVVGPPALALANVTAGAGEWKASAGEPTTIEVAFSSAGGAGKGIYVEVGGPAFTSGLVVAETASVGDGPAAREAQLARRGSVARAELPDVVLKAAHAIDPSTSKRPRPMPAMIARVRVRGGTPGANLLTIRVGPLGAAPGRGSALQGKRVVTR